MALLLAVAGWTVPAAAQTIEVTPLTQEGRLLVSFELSGAFTDDMRDAIRSGLPTSFLYEIELRRGVAFWLDRTIATATVSAQVRYDNLTRRYQVSMLHDGRVEWTRHTDKEAVVETWMTEFRQLPLFSTTPLEPNAEYYLRIRAVARPRNDWFLPPWGRAAASGRVRFTFTP